MTKKERILNTLEGRPADRPPVCFWRHFGNLEPAETVKAHLSYFHDSGIDLLKMMCDEFFVYPMDVNATPEEILRMKPLGSASHYVRGQAERASQINDALHGEAFTLYNAFSPYATLKHTLGDEKSMALIREHEEAALHLLNIICEDTCEIVKAVLTESGTMGMMLPLQGAEHGRFSDEDYARLIAPTERAVIECAQKYSDKNLLHMCGWDGIPDHLERWEGYQTRMINWDVDVEGLSLADGRKRFGDRVLLGGFNNRPGTLLTAGSKADIQAFTRKLLWSAGRDRLIIGADCSIPKDIDLARIHWIIEALEA